MEILNGTGKPRIEITFTDASTATIDLPYCQNLQERIEEIHNIHTMIDKSLEIDRIGIRWACTLGYKKLMKGAVFQSVGPLMSADVAIIYVTPRVDIPSRKFLVYWANRLQVERAFAQGHAGVELQFEGMETLTGMVMLGASVSWPKIQNDHTLINSYHVPLGVPTT